jgi:hypothetical protein
MVVAEKVSVQVVTMTAPETIVEAREQVLTMASPSLGGLSEIHHSRGLRRCNILAIIYGTVQRVLNCLFPVTTWDI